MSAESPRSFHIATQRSKSKDAIGKFAAIASIDGQRVQCDRNAAVIVEFDAGLEALFEQLRAPSRSRPARRPKLRRRTAGARAV